MAGGRHEVLMLGPLVVSVDGRPVAVTSRRLRVVLAVLALSAGRVVPVDRLVTAIWTSAESPAKPAAAVRLYVSRLRTLLGAGPITTVGSGYLLDLDSDQVDVLRFGRILAAAATATDPADEHGLLAQALGLWRGTPFEDIGSAWLDKSQTPQLVERYLAAVERRVDLDLAGRDASRDAGRDAGGNAGGEAGGLVPELRELTARFPLRESLWVRLLAALRRAGRPAEALERYETIRVRLAEELGTDPGPQLRQIYADLLAGKAPEQPPDRRVAVPRQLLADVAAFTGRASEMASVERAEDPTTAVSVAIHGMAGIGKTTLAIHAAHRIAGRYQDGQLFIDLNGHTEGLAPVEPADALDRLLRSLGVPGAQIPSNQDDRAALYRSRLAGQRILIVLDNAATEAQVRPLLPGTPGCLVLVTSRHRLAGLETTHAVALDVMPRSDALDLFTSAAGPRRLAGEAPDLIAETVELCGRLPLAISIAAARLRSHTTWGLSRLVEQLREHQDRLSELAAGERSVTAALDLSYLQLTDGLRRAYRLLGMHPGPDIDAYATAALLDTAVRPTRRLLDQLLEANLMQEPVAGRYRFHDLTRAHAANQTDPAEPAALDRLLDYYRWTASLAMDTAYPYAREHRPQVPPSKTPVPDLADPATALGWLDAERPNLLAAARFAAGHGRPAHILDLSAILHRHLRIRGRYHDAEALHRHSLATARDTGNPASELDSLNHLGEVHRLLGGYQQAADHYGEALELARATRDRLGELDALTGLGHLHWQQGRYPEATDHHQRALRLARAIGNRFGELEALTGLGHLDSIQGRYPEATDHYQRALRLALATGNRLGERAALAGLGRVHRLQGRYEQATDNLEQALRVALATGDRVGELDALAGLGDLHRQLGRHEQATDYFVQSSRVSRAIGNRVGELTALAGLGYLHRLQGRYEQAADSYQRLKLLATAQEYGDRNFEFEAWQGLGRLRCITGDPAAAIAHHERALALAGELGQPDDEARAHDGLAHAYAMLDQLAQARRHWRRALDILTELGIDNADDEETTAAAIRTHLADLDARVTT